MKEIRCKEVNRILLVDDDSNLSFLISDYLESQGFKVIAVGNGKQALEILNLSIIDLIITDIVMPVMDGYVFLEKLRTDFTTECIPVIILSSKGQSSDRIKGLEAGADFYMVKPFEPEELLAQIKSLLRQRKRLSLHQKINSTLDYPQVPQQTELTQMEKRVLQLVVKNLSNVEIAEKLHVSQRTIESHLSNMLNKTNFKNRRELSCWYCVKGDYNN